MTLDRCRGEAERLGSLLDREATKVAQLHDPGFFGVDGFEPGEHGIEPEDVDFGIGLWDIETGERHLQTAVALGGGPAARVIDENIPHDPGDDAHEMRAVLPVDVGRAVQSEKGFVDERRRLQGMVGPFARKLAIGHCAQVGIRNVDDAAERGLVAVAPG